MLKTELKTCKKCGKMYTKTSGGIVSNPIDFADSGLCMACKSKVTGEAVKKIKGIFKK